MQWDIWHGNQSFYQVELSTDQIFHHEERSRNEAYIALHCWILENFLTTLSAEEL